MKFPKLAAIGAAAALVAVTALPSAAQQQQEQGGQSQSSPPSAPSPPPSAPPQAQPQGGSAPSTMQSGSQGRQQVQVDVNSLIGAAVRSSDGREIGKVDKLMIDPREGRVTTVVVSRGGTLGMGGDTMSVPWDSVRVGQDRNNVVLTVDQQLLDQAPSASPKTEDKGGKQENGQQQRQQR